MTIDASRQGQQPLRAVARIIDEWAYDIAQKWFAFFGGDTKLAAICLFTELANTEYVLADAALAARYRSRFVAPEDCRPVPLASIAQALNLDAETVRRKIVELKARGLAITDERGVIINLDYLTDNALRDEYENLSSRLNKLIADLDRLIINNGYDPEPLADLAAELAIDHAAIDGCSNLVAILIGKYMSRTLVEGSLIFGADRDSAAVYFTIYVENKRQITHDPVLSKAYAWLDSPTPREERWPVSASFVARKVGLPAETVRRKINRMIAIGIIERTTRGLLAIPMPGVMDLHATRAWHQIIALLKSVQRITSLAAVPDNARPA
ncbi:MAG: hypothetical protein ACOYO0_02055 [Sandarakinorhabdus sp.]